MTRLIVLNAILLAIGLPTFANDAARAKALFAKCLEASGGEAATKAVTSRVMKGTFNLNQMGNWPIVSSEKAPNLKHSIVSIPEYGQVEEAFDGNVAWKLEPNKPLRLLAGYELFEKKHEARFYRNLELLTEYENLTLLPQRKINGKLYDLVKAAYRSEPDLTFFLDVETHLVGRIVMSRPNNVTVTITMDDYRPVGALTVAHKYNVTIESPAMPEAIRISMAFTSCSHNAPIDNAIFAAPNTEKDQQDQNLAVP